MKSQALRTICYLMLLVTIGSFTLLTSCKDKEPEEKIGITNLKFTPTTGTITYSCEIDQEKMTIINSKDSLPSYYPMDGLKSVKIEHTPTLGATAYINDMPISENEEYDLREPITVVVKKENAKTKTYQLKVVKSTNDASAKLGVKLTSDMTQQGLPKYHDIDVALFKNKFYALISRYSGEFEKAFYELYSSDNGIDWKQVNTSPNSIGGQGARLAVFKDKLYVLGGARIWGVDENGVEAENTWGIATIENWRSWSTSDGTNWEVDTVGVQTETYKKWNGSMGTRKKLPIPLAYANIVNFNGKLYLKGGKAITFGQGQPARAYYSTPDGKNWDELKVTNAEDDFILARADEAFFTFNNKLWIIGGFKNYLTPDNVLGDIWSSSDGQTWSSEATEAPFGKIYGHKVITDGKTLLLIGGETVNADGTRSLSNKVYRSTDGKTWTEVEIASGFEARRNAPVVANESTVWIFGGWGESSGNYAFTDKTKDVVIRDTWTKGIQ